MRSRFLVETHRCIYIVYFFHRAYCVLLVDQHRTAAYVDVSTDQRNHKDQIVGGAGDGGSEGEGKTTLTECPHCCLFSRVN